VANSHYQPVDKTQLSVMNGLQRVGGILDDLIITGSNDETHFFVTWKALWSE